jgi:two-component system response regulator
MNMKNGESVDILLVEDNPNDRDLMVRVFRRHNIPMPIHVAENGKEALDFIFGRGPYEERSGAMLPKVIFLDLNLPKMNGLEVLRSIKTDDRTRHIPVVIVTSSQEETDVRNAYALGANGYVVKPLDFDAFSASMGTMATYWIDVNHPPGNLNLNIHTQPMQGATA